MGEGRKVPCGRGHIGEVVIGTYVECKVCDRDSVPAHIDPEKTEPMWACRRCPSCNSLDIEQFDDDVDAAFFFWNVSHIPSSTPMPPQAQEWGCHGCGTVFARPK